MGRVQENDLADAAWCSLLFYLTLFLKSSIFTLETAPTKSQPILRTEPKTTFEDGSDTEVIVG